MTEDRTEREREAAEKWRPFEALRSPAVCDRYAREVLGITLHAGSTAEEIARVVRIYKARW